MLHKLCRDKNHSVLLAYLDGLKEQESDSRLAFLANQRNSEKYSPLHVSLFERNLQAVSALLSVGADVNAKCHGIPPLHLAVRTAAQPEGQEYGLQAFALLLKDPAINPLAKDDNGLTVLHLAAGFNLPAAIRLLAEHSAGLLDKLLLAAPRLTGVTALHMAAANDADDAVRLLLLSGASASAQLTVCKSTPLHRAASCGSLKAYALLAAVPDAAGLADFMGRTAAQVLSAGAARGGTVLVTSPLCLDYHTCPPAALRTPIAPPENARRLTVLMDAQAGSLRAADLRGGTRWIENAEPAPLGDVLRVHEWAYVRALQAKCQGLEGDELASMDPDTVISSGSYRAALGAAGAVCRAVDEVVRGGAVNAFCPVRPPGHHAGPKGLVLSGGGGDSHGFCLLNNVSIAAAHALSTHRDIVRKVAIVDIDVHHGNGTEETVRWLSPRLEQTDVGGAGDVFGRLYVPKYKPWFGEQDPDNVLFVSVHGYSGGGSTAEGVRPPQPFYPGTGPTHVPRLVPVAAAAAVIPGSAPATHSSSEECAAMDDLDQQSAGSDSDEEEDSSAGSSGRDDDQDQDQQDDEEEGSNSNDSDSDSSYGASAPSPRPRSASDAVEALRRIYTSSGVQSRPSTSSEVPEPLILDIGVTLPVEEVLGEDEDTPLGRALADLSYRLQWRAHFRDVIFPRILQFQPDLLLVSAGFDAHKRDGINGGYIALADEDFAWVTASLAAVADTCCAGRLVSVLEGGYQLGGDFASAFARSVHDHVQELARAAGTGGRGVTIEGLRAEGEAEAALLQGLRVQRAEELRLLREKEEEEVRRERERAMQAEQEVVVEEEVAVPQLGGEAGDAEEGSGGGSRKRRRPAVDYAALDEQLRAKGVDK